MNAERLLQYYGRIAEAPDAVSRLRRFILDLAVRGKLVPQFPDEEPASQLLKRIAEEKVLLVKAGEISRDKPLPPLTGADTIFKLPRGWEWVRLGHLSKMVTSGSRDWAKHYAKEGAIFVRMGNLSKDHYRLRLGHIQHVKPPADSEGSRTRLAPGDILISITGEVGMLGLIPDGFGEGYINQHTAMVRPITEMRGRYLPELFRSPFAQAQFNEPQRGIKNSFRLTDITQFVVPLPPIAEQHRIVAKVDELMALCDQLDAAREAREAARDKVTAASLARLDAPDPKTFRADARLALEALPALTVRPDQIKRLRQTILNLAVRGKLVPQDPGDEPATELLKRVEKEKAQLVKSGALKAERHAKVLSSHVKAFELPEGWTWAILQAVCLSISDGDHQPPPKSEVGVPFLVIGDVRTKTINYGAERKVPQQYFDGLDPIRKPKQGDLLYTLVGSFGIPVPVRSKQPFCVQRHIGILRPSSQLDLQALALFLESEFALDQAEAVATGIAQKTVPLAGLRSMVLPLSPVAEQRRIVARVDELMALCDKLEASLVQADEMRYRLLEALLAEALAPAQERDLEAAE